MSVFSPEYIGAWSNQTLANQCHYFFFLVIFFSWVLNANLDDLFWRLVHKNRMLFDDVMTVCLFCLALFTFCFSWFCLFVCSDQKFNNWQLRTEDSPWKVGHVLGPHDWTTATVNPMADFQTRLLRLQSEIHRCSYRVGCYSLRLLTGPIILRFLLLSEGL